MDFGTIAAKMTLDLSNFTSQLNLAQSQAQKLAEKSSKAVDIGSAMTKLGKGLTAAVTLPLAGIAAASIKVGNEFEAQMSRVQAISGATGAKFEEMEKQAIQLGAKTAFSAKEAAAGMENLASAGFTADEIMSAIPGTLDLAAVSGGDVAASAESMASSLRAFGLDASQAGHVANVFAKAAADTNAETSDMAEAMKYIAPVAHAMGLSIEETAASIGIMADAGIKGSQAGTTLRGALSRIAKPTKAMTKSMEALGVSFYDAQGNMIPLKDQIGQLKQATAGLTQEERNRHLVTLYGQQSLSGMLALLDAGPEKLDNMTNSFKNSSGAAQEMAEIMQNNLSSKIEQMFGAFESAAIIIQQILAPALTKVVEGITKMVEAFVNMSPLGQKMVVIFGLFVAALGPLLIIVGTAITTFAKLKLAIQFLGPAFMGTLGAVAAVTAVIVALVAVFLIAYTRSETFRNFVNNLAAAIRDGLVVAIQWLVEKFNQIIPYFKQVAESAKELGQAIGGKMVSMWNSFMESIGKTGTTLKEFISGGLEKLGGAFGKVGGVVSIAVSIFTKIGLAMIGITGPIGIVIRLIVALVSAWARTGDFSADGITKAFDQITQSITNVADMISQYLPVFIQKGTEILVNLIQGMTNQIPAITAKITEIITQLVTTLSTVLPMLIAAGIQILTSLIEGITQSLPTIVQAAISIMKALLDAIIQALPQLLAAGIQIITALVNALVTALPAIIDAGIQILMALIQGIIQILPTLIGAALQIIMALVQAFIDALPQLIDAGIQIIMALIEGLIQMLPAIIEAIVQILVALVEALIAALPQLIDAGIKLITALVQGLIQVIPQVIAGIFKILAALIQAIIQHLPQLLSAGVNLLQALIQGIGSMLGSLLSMGGNLLSQLIGKIGSFAGQMLSKGVELIAKFISGVASKIGSAVGKIGEMGSQMISRVGGFVGQMASAGHNFVMGFVNGISGAIGAAANAAANMAKSAMNAAKSFLGIKSPSRKMMKVGAWTAEGMALGIEGMVTTVRDKAAIMAEAVSDAMSNVTMGINDNGIVETAKKVFDELQATIPESISTSAKFDTLRRATETPEVDIYNKDKDKDVDGKEDKPEKDGGGTVNIGTIIVRSDDDLDKLSRGLYNKSKETLSGLGNIVTP